MWEKGRTFWPDNTCSKSIDQASNLGEQLNPLNARTTRAISAWDMRQSFVASYKMALPFDLLFKGPDRLADGWGLAGTTRFSSGFPVTLYDDSDNSLLGTLGNAINNNLLDTRTITGCRSTSIPIRGRDALVRQFKGGAHDGDSRAIGQCTSAIFLWSRNQ